MRKSWSKEELEIIRWAAILIRQDTLSYYQVMKNLRPILKRSGQSIRAKLRLAVRAEQEQMLEEEYYNAGYDKGFFD